MSMAELAAIIESGPPVKRYDPIKSTAMPASAANILAARGINTVGALMDTDAFKAIISGRYDSDKVREVNGIPISALRWLLDEIALQYA